MESSQRCDQGIGEEQSDGLGLELLVRRAAPSYPRKAISADRPRADQSSAVIWRGTGAALSQ
jgi:hypothetical protein